MTATDELIEIADRLKEARRYVRTNVPATREMIAACIDRIKFHYTMFDKDVIVRPRIYRAVHNLDVGLEYIQVCPQVLEGYIDGAAFELRLRGE